MTQDYYLEQTAGEALVEVATQMRQSASRLEGVVADLEGDISKHRDKISVLLRRADEFEGAAARLDMFAIKFKTIGSTYELDEAARTWRREPNTHGPSGSLPKESGTFRGHTPAVVGSCVVIEDLEIGTFTTSVVTEVLDAR